MKQLWFLYRFPGWLLFNIKYFGANRSIFDRANADFMRKSHAQQFITSSILYLGLISIWGLSASGFWDQGANKQVRVNPSVASPVNAASVGQNSISSDNNQKQPSADTANVVSEPDGQTVSEAAPNAAPSFDCEAATGAVEKMICANPQLASEDRQLSQLYKQVMSEARDSDADRIKNDQRIWIEDDRNGCEDDACLSTAYTNRINYLRNDLASVSQSEQ